MCALTYATAIWATGRLQPQNVNHVETLPAVVWFLPKERIIRPNYYCFHGPKTHQTKSSRIVVETQQEKGQDGCRDRFGMCRFGRKLSSLGRYGAYNYRIKAIYYFFNRLRWPLNLTVRFLFRLFIPMMRTLPLCHSYFRINVWKIDVTCPQTADCPVTDASTFVLIFCCCCLGQRQLVVS